MSRDQQMTCKSEKWELAIYLQKPVALEFRIYELIDLNVAISS
jgi:hypothetical protein